MHVFLFGSTRTGTPTERPKLPTKNALRLRDHPSISKHTIESDPLQELPASCRRTCPGRCRRAAHGLYRRQEPRASKHFKTREFRNYSHFCPRGGKKKLSHELQFGSGRTRPKPKRHKSERGQCSDLDSQPSPVPSCCWLECPTRQVHCCHLYTPDQQLRSLIEGARVRTRDTNAQQRNTRGGEP